MFYCNTVGSQTEIVFDGGSLVYDRDGGLVKEMNYFKEDYAVFDLERMAVPKAKKQTVTAAGRPATSEEEGNPSTISAEEARKYYYSPFEVGRDADTLNYLPY